MSQSQQNSASLQDRARESFNAAYLVCRILAFPVELVFTRFGTWGQNYLDVSSLFGFIWPVGFYAAVPAAVAQ